MTAAAAGAITAARLLYWGDLEERRRRTATRAGRFRVVGLLVAGGALAALVARQADTDPATASRLALAVIVASYTAVMLATPFRMYWRPDSPLLARLPIPGGALFDVALLRSLRAAAAATLVAGPAAAAMAVAEPELALRHLAIAGTVALASALLLPSVALGAGGLVAGGKAQALINAVGGTEVAAPPSAWLGVLPGLAAAGIVLAVIAAGSWAAGGDGTIVGPPAALLGGTAAASILSALAARQSAPRVMPLAVREVAALDVQRLAHLEIHPPTGIERAVMRRLGPGAALIYGKDARLLRRRFPMAFVTGAATTAALWAIAVARPASAWVWVATIMLGFCAYALVMASRLVARPIELGYVATLPVAAAAIARAKITYLAVWTLLYPALGAIPVAIVAPAGALCAAIIGVGAGGALLIGARVVRRG